MATGEIMGASHEQSHSQHIGLLKVGAGVFRFSVHPSTRPVDAVVQHVTQQPHIAPKIVGKDPNQPPFELDFYIDASYLPPDDKVRHVSYLATTGQLPPNTVTLMELFSSEGVQLPSTSINHRDRDQGQLFDPFYYS